MQNGYSICFNEWALDKDIKNELGLLLIISSLTAEKGYCFASNSYFAELFNLPEETVSRKIKKLERRGYITISYKRRGCEIVNREIRLVYPNDYQNNQSTIDKNVNRTINKNVKDNNISDNNINNNIYVTPKKTKKDFVPPTVEEVKSYCQEKGYSVDCNKFVEYYSVNNWRDKNNKPVKNWKLKLLCWNGNSFQNKKGSLVYNSGTDDISQEELDNINF